MYQEHIIHPMDYQDGNLNQVMKKNPKTTLKTGLMTSMAAYTI